MALQTIQQLKNWFKRGLKPTEVQFADWMDSYFHKGEAIPIASVSGLQDALDGGDVGSSFEVDGSREIVIPAEKKLVSMHVWAAANKVVKLGNGNGTGEYFTANVVANKVYSNDLSLFFLNEQSIFVSGSGTFNIKYYLA